MNAIQTIAATKLVSDKQKKQARGNVSPGHYSTDFWLHVTGTLDVADDYTRRVPQKACPWNLFAVALSHLNGVTVESITREALEADAELVAAIKKQAEQAIAAIKGTTETVCVGRIAADLSAEVVVETAIAEAA